MPRNDDLDLDLAPEPTRGTPPTDDGSMEPGRRLVVIVAGIALIFILGIAWYWWSSRDTATPATDAAATTEAPLEDPADPLGSGPPAELPPLGELDPTVRTLLSALSSRPELTRLIATDDLVRRFVVSIDRIGRGVSPSAQVSVLRPADQFSVEQPNSETAITPGSFGRYDGVVTMVASLDPDDLARIYGQLRPRLNEAYAELGVPGENFDAAVERAIVHLLSVDPSLASGRVVPVKGTTYAWADQRTENLSSAQKQLLRLGPAHARAVQDHLRRVAQALGIAAERLPAR